jgi:hypothetical protein
MTTVCTVIDSPLLSIGPLLWRSTDHSIVTRSASLSSVTRIAAHEGSLKTE